MCWLHVGVIWGPYNRDSMAAGRAAAVLPWGGNSMGLECTGVVDSPSTPACRPCFTARGSSIAASGQQQAVQMLGRTLTEDPASQWCTYKLARWPTNTHGAFKVQTVWIGSHGCCTYRSTLKVCATLHQCVGYVCA